MTNDLARLINAANTDGSNTDGDLESAMELTQIFIFVGFGLMIAGYAIWWIRQKKS